MEKHYGILSSVRKTFDENIRKKTGPIDIIDSSESQKWLYCGKQREEQ
jgi:hypothetical protein